MKLAKMAFHISTNLEHLHFELNDSILETHVDNITPVLLYCRPDPCVQKLLNHLDSIIVIVIDFSVSRDFSALMNNRKSRVKKVHHSCKYFRFHDLPLDPLVIIFGHSDKVATKEDSFHAVNPKQELCQRASFGRRNSRNVKGAASLQHSPPR